MNIESGIRDYLANLPKVGLNNLQVENFVLFSRREGVKPYFVAGNHEDKFVVSQHMDPTNGELKGDIQLISPGTLLGNYSFLDFFIEIYNMQRDMKPEDNPFHYSNIDENLQRLRSYGIKKVNEYGRRGFVYDLFSGKGKLVCDLAVEAEFEYQKIFLEGNNGSEMRKLKKWLIRELYQDKEVPKACHYIAEDRKPMAAHVIDATLARGEDVEIPSLGTKIPGDRS